MFLDWDPCLCNNKAFNISVRTHSIRDGFLLCSGRVMHTNYMKCHKSDQGLAHAVGRLRNIHKYGMLIKALQAVIVMAWKTEVIS